jgi:predicted phage tail component-like protein
LLSYTVNTPEIREYTEEADGRAGVYDYGSEWGKREITVTVDVTPNTVSLKRRQSRILAWLSPVSSGAGALVFDEVPDVQYYAKLTGRVGIEQFFRGYGEFTFTFVCADPFGYSTYSVETIDVDSAVLVDTDISVDAAYSFAVTGAATFNIDNFGYEAVRPIIEISGSFTTLTITAGGETLTYANAMSAQTLVVDFDRYTSTITGTPVNVSGSYGEIAAGITPISVGGTGINATITFKFRTKFI